MATVDAYKLKWKLPQLTLDDINSLVDRFNQCQLDSTQHIDQKQLISVCQTLPGNYSYDDVRDAIKRADVSTSGKLDVEEFLSVVAKLKDSVKSSVTKEDKAGRRRTVMMGKQAGTAHTFDEDEKVEFVQHINAIIQYDADAKTRYPIDPQTMRVFDEVQDGIILAKLVNDAVPDTIDERVINRGAKLNAFQMTENNNLVINSAKAIGCNVVNIGAMDIIEGREHLILGLIWQLIKIGLLAKVDIKLNPNLYRLLEPGETLEQFLRLPADQILLRWFNYHLKAANWSRRVANFSGDVKDGENYTVLLNQLCPDKCTRGPLQERDLLRRAEQVLENADRIGCRKFLTARAMVNGNPRLNLAFVANLFNNYPGLEPLEPSEAPPEIEYDYETDREARAFSYWMNSLGVDPFINHLYTDLQDGLILLQVIDKIHPNLVEWRRVNNQRPVTSRFKQVENTNMAINLGKHIGYSLVGIQGADITDANRTLTLAFVWQLMRDHVVQTLKTLSKGGRDVTEADMIKWANETVQRGGKSSKMMRFQDSSLRSGVYFLDLLNGMSPGSVDYKLVTPGRTSVFSCLILL